MGVGVKLLEQFRLCHVSEFGVERARIGVGAIRVTKFESITIDAS